MASNVGSERQDVYEECAEVVTLRRHSGVYLGNPYTVYYLTLGGDARIKVILDADKKSLLNQYVPFNPVAEEFGVE